jgi:hypothetical protein
MQSIGTLLEEKSKSIFNAFRLKTTAHSKDKNQGNPDIIYCSGIFQDTKNKIRNAVPS